MTPLQFRNFHQELLKKKIKSIFFLFSIKKVLIFYTVFISSQLWILFYSTFKHPVQEFTANISHMHGKKSKNIFEHQQNLSNFIFLLCSRKDVDSLSANLRNEPEKSKEIAKNK